MSETVVYYSYVEVPESDDGGLERYFASREDAETWQTSFPGDSYVIPQTVPGVNVTDLAAFVAWLNDMASNV